MPFWAARCQWRWVVVLGFTKAESSLWTLRNRHLLSPASYTMGVQMPLMKSRLGELLILLFGLFSLSLLLVDLTCFAVIVYFNQRNINHSIQVVGHIFGTWWQCSYLLLMNDMIFIASYIILKLITISIIATVFNIDNTHNSLFYLSVLVTSRTWRLLLAQVKQWCKCLMLKENPACGILPSVRHSSHSKRYMMDRNRSFQSHNSSRRQVMGWT